MRLPPDKELLKTARFSGRRLNCGTMDLKEYQRHVGGIGFGRMKDRLTTARRSWNMSRIRGKDTGPERIVRSLIHRMGYRFRLHGKKLPGRPDIIMAKYKTVVFVHGCFWHRHRRCKNCTTPTNNREFWVKKLEGNAVRDAKNQRNFRRLGWRVLIVWECAVEQFARGRPSRLVATLKRALPGDAAYGKTRIEDRLTGGKQFRSPK
jgi:DNA mismatch endonuclease (patch repair protein)